ncbi:MAG: hypothetical protein ACI4FZ_10485 [Lachnospiraceae bacterium]
MKVAFWSDFRRVGGVTGNLAAITAVCALHYGRTVVVNSDHLSNHNLQDCFWKKSLLREREETAFCYCYGETEYFRFLWEEYGPFSGVSAEKQLMEKVSVLYPPDLLETTLFRETVSKDTLFFLDVVGERHGAAKQALEEADLVAVFLPQNMSAIKSFFDRYSSLIPKSIFFISDYVRTRSRETGCSPARFAKKFNVDSQKVSTIPHNQEFAEACEEGRIESFIRENLPCTIKNKNYSFIQHLLIAAEMILAGEKGE